MGLIGYTCGVLIPLALCIVLFAYAVRFADFLVSAL